MNLDFCLSFFVFLSYVLQYLVVVCISTVLKTTKCGIWFFIFLFLFSLLDHKV